jgi:hypothetical protein
MTATTSRMAAGVATARVTTRPPAARTADGPSRRATYVGTSAAWATNPRMTYSWTHTGTVTARPTSSMTAAPTVPAKAAAPTDARDSVAAAPIPAWAIPAVVVPAITAAKPDELRVLDEIEAVGRRSHRVGRANRHCVRSG